MDVTANQHYGTCLLCPMCYLMNTAMLQINRINEEKRAIMDQLEDAERQLKKRDDEVARLRRENDMLRDEVCPRRPYSFYLLSEFWCPAFCTRPCMP